MTRLRPWRRSAWWVAASAAALVLTACEGGARSGGERGPSFGTGPTGAPAPESRPAPPVATQPAIAPPSSQPASQPATASAPAEPELPEYLTIVQKQRTDATADAQVLTMERQRLVLETRNVQRLRIDRDKLPLDRRRSVALVLDGQPVEWLAKSPVTEFERSANGVWIPVPPRKPGSP